MACLPRVRTPRLLQREESSLSVRSLGPLQEFDLTFPRGRAPQDYGPPRRSQTRLHALAPLGTYSLLILCYLALRTL